MLPFVCTVPHGYMLVIPNKSSLREQTCNLLLWWCNMIQSQPLHTCISSNSINWHFNFFNKAMIMNQTPLFKANTTTIPKKRWDADDKNRMQSLANKLDLPTTDLQSAPEPTSHKAIRLKSSESIKFCHSYQWMSVIKAILAANHGSGLSTWPACAKCCSTHLGFQVCPPAVSMLASHISTAHYFWILKLLLSTTLNLHAPLYASGEEREREREGK